MDLGIRPVADETGRFRYWVAIQRDITQQKETELALLLAQKIEAIGQLSSGVAHDFNNILTAILGSIEVLERIECADARFATLVERIKNATERGASVTRQLLTVAQPTASGVIVKIGVNDEIMRSFDLLITSGARQIELKTDLTPEEPTLRADLGLFGAALLNLMINARDAMPDGGILTVRTRTHFDQALGGPVVAISVTDTGFGMSPELQAKIFAPFFTTKGDAGSGLGLSMVRKFVEQAGGRISLASIVGRGTTFTLIFPLDSIAHQKFEPEVACTTNSGRAKPQRVMVMDVDAAVSEAISMVLRDEGFSVLSTTNGDLALSALAQDEYALAIIDPSGLHVPTALFDIGLPILVLSSALQSLVRNESPVLEKPFNAAALLRAVRHAAGLQPPQPSLFTFTQA